LFSFGTSFMITFPAIWIQFRLDQFSRCSSVTRLRAGIPGSSSWQERRRVSFLTPHLI
jgi:hypothetical protein